MPSAAASRSAAESSHGSISQRGEIIQPRSLGTCVARFARSTQRTRRTQRKHSSSHSLSALFSHVGGFMKPNETSHVVIGAAMRVHSALGAGVLESACDACMYYEFTQAGLHFEHQVRLPVVYSGIELKTAYRVDFIVESCLVVEIKCVEKVLPVHRAQVLSYLKLSGLPLGL